MMPSPSPYVTPHEGTIYVPTNTEESTPTAIPGSAPVSVRKGYNVTGKAVLNTMSLKDLYVPLEYLRGVSAAGYTITMTTMNGTANSTVDDEGYFHMDLPGRNFTLNVYDNHNALVYQQAGESDANNHWLGAFVEINVGEAYLRVQWTANEQTKIEMR